MCHCLLVDMAIDFGKKFITYFVQKICKCMFTVPKKIQLSRKKQAEMKYESMEKQQALSREVTL